MRTLIDAQRRRLAVWGVVGLSILLLLGGVVLAILEVGGVWSLACSVLGGLGLVAGLLVTQ